MCVRMCVCVCVGGGGDGGDGGRGYNTILPTSTFNSGTTDERLSYL